MAKLSVRVRINPGRIGAPLRKLSLVSQELHSFLKSAVSDLNFISEDMEWIARDFKNGSVEYTAVNNGTYGAQEAREFSNEIVSLILYEAKEAPYKGRFKKTTLHQYANIGGPLDADERLDIGIPDENGNVPEWRSLTKEKSQSLIASIERRNEYLGAVFGKINALYKEQSPPYFNLRVVDSGELVNCYYEQQDYPEVYKLLKDPNAYVHVGGLISVDVVTKKIERVYARKYRSVPTFDKERFEGLIAKSGIYSDIDTEEFLSWYRDDE